jgi:hypothetical protein
MNRLHKRVEALVLTRLSGRGKMRSSQETLRISNANWETTFSGIWVC